MKRIGPIGHAVDEPEAVGCVAGQGALGVRIPAGCCGGVGGVIVIHEVGEGDVEGGGGVYLVHSVGDRVAAGSVELIAAS